MRNVRLILLLALFTGCREKPTSRLAHQIAGADHIVVTYYNPRHSPSQFSNFSIAIITGNDARKIVEAISGAKPVRWDTLCSPEWELQFYHWTNRLAAVDLGCDLIFINQGQYEDSSGILGKLDRALEAQSHRAPAPTRGTIGPLQSY